jgi:hypothetical protein
VIWQEVERQDLEWQGLEQQGLYLLCTRVYFVLQSLG